MVLLNTCSCGICSLTLLLMIIQMSISGGLNHQAIFLPGRPIVLFSLVQPFLSLGNGFGKPGHPGKCKTFIWLAVRNCCWTADRLQKRGLPHPEHCPLCDQDDETVQHLLTSCVFARQFWFSILQPLNLTSLVPNRRCASLAEWWKKSWRKIPKQHRKGFNSLVILGAWTLWKQRNACVFYGATPNIQRAL